MSYFAYSFRFAAGRSDRKRDRNLKVPEDVRALCNIPYGLSGKSQWMDLYFPKDSSKDGKMQKLPVIVSVHGGGYVYGTKEVYKHYCMFLAQQGFFVVNFNYTLAPKQKFPGQLCEINQVMEWLEKRRDKYPIDLENMFLVGDSAGAQLASHYCAIHTNPEFEELFPFRTPKTCRIRAVGLNCGMYVLENNSEDDTAQGENKGILREYLGTISVNDPRLQVMDAVTEKFPSAYVMTSEHDFLKECAKPFFEHLTEKGVEAEYHFYTSPKTELGHVFHCNMNLEEAKNCNKDECRFFRKYITLS